MINYFHFHFHFHLKRNETEFRFFFHLSNEIHNKITSKLQEEKLNFDLI